MPPRWDLLIAAYHCLYPQQSQKYALRQFEGLLQEGGPVRLDIGDTAATASSRNDNTPSTLGDTYYAQLDSRLREVQDVSLIAVGE
jgi:hypothetical protein